MKGTRDISWLSIKNAFTPTESWTITRTESPPPEETIGVNKKHDKKIWGHVKRHLLVGGLEHFYFPIYWEFHHPNWPTHIFQRGGPTTNQLSFFLQQSHWLPSGVPLWTSQNSQLIRQVFAGRAWDSHRHRAGLVRGEAPRCVFREIWGENWEKIGEWWGSQWNLDIYHHLSIHGLFGLIDLSFYLAVDD